MGIKMKQFATVAALSAAMMISGTQAQAGDWYGQLHGEFTWTEETDLDIAGTKVGDLKYDLEYAAGAALGYAPSATQTMLDDMRFEAEVMYREADFDKLSGVLAPGGFGGSLESYTLMGNAYYDFKNDTGFTPYIGVGAGMARHSFDSITIGVDDDDTTFVYQGMLGVSYAMQDWEGVTLGLGYRYFGSQDPDFSTRTGSKVDMDYASHNLEYFLRYTF